MRRPLEARLAVLISGLAVLLLPLAFWPPFEDAFKLPQCALVALVLSGLLAATSPVPRIFINPAAVPVLALIGGHILSASLGVGGRFADAAWFAALPCLALVFTGARRLVPSLMTAAGAVSAAYSVVQFAGFDPAAPWHTIGARPFSTMGNPDFLAAYLAAVFPLAVIRWIVFPSAPRCAIWAVIAAALVLSQSRGAWIGIAAAAAAAPLVMRAGGRHFTVRRTWKTAAALACVLLFAAGFFVLNAQARERLANMANVRHFDAAGRLAMWRASLDMIRSRPLLGGGPGSFASGYPARHARILRENPAFPYFHTENAHNDWLQLPAEEGVLVFGLWLWIWAIFAAGAWRGVRAGNSTAAGFLLGFSALQVNAFFNFPWYLIPSQGWFWFAWGWLNGGEGNAGRAGKTSQRRIAVAAVVPLVVGVLIGRDLIANGWLKLSGDFLAASRWREAFLCSTRAQERWVGWENRYRAADNGSRAAYQLGDYKEAERQCRRSLAEFPDMPGGLSQLGLVLARQGRLAEAKAACARALYLNRHQADSWHVLGNIAFIERDNREAARCWRRAVEENPGLTGARDSLAALEAGNRKRKM